jgi:hypothetical protein
MNFRRPEERSIQSNSYLRVVSMYTMPSSEGSAVQYSENKIRVLLSVKGKKYGYLYQAVETNMVVRRRDIHFS